MADHYLRFADAAQAEAELAAAGLALAGGPDHGIDPVGTVWSDAVLDGNGDVVTAAAALDGYHANLRLLTGSLPTSLESFVVNPSSPFRVFAT